MGDGMKFTIDDTKTIIMALDELKGVHCYNRYENDYEWEQSFEKRWADEIDALLKRFNKSLKLKMIDQRIAIEIAQHERLHNEDML
jgi:hypothetical protein